MTCGMCYDPAFCAHHRVCLGENMAMFKAHFGDEVKVDLTKCPNCGGPADNGHDRCYPPNPYWCSKCMRAEEGPK